MLYLLDNALCRLGMRAAVRVAAGVAGTTNKGCGVQEHDNSEKRRIFFLHDLLTCARVACVLFDKVRMMMVVVVEWICASIQGSSIRSRCR